MYLSLIHVQTLHKKYVNHCVIHSNMWGNLYLFVCCCFSWKHLSWRNLQKAGILPWSGLVAKWHSGIPFHNHENVLRLMCAESPASWLSHIPLFSPLLGKTSWFREPTGLWSEKAENEEKLLGTAWVLRNHNKHWQFKHFAGCRHRWAGPLLRASRGCTAGAGQGWRPWVLFEAHGCCWNSFLVVAGLRPQLGSDFQTFKKSQKSVIGYKFY